MACNGSTGHNSLDAIAHGVQGGIVPNSFEGDNDSSLTTVQDKTASNTCTYLSTSSTKYIVSLVTGKQAHRATHQCYNGPY